MGDSDEPHHVPGDVGGDGHFAEGAGSSGDRISCITAVGNLFPSRSPAILEDSQPLYKNALAFPTVLFVEKSLKT